MLEFDTNSSAGTNCSAVTVSATTPMPTHHVRSSAAVAATASDRPTPTARPPRYQRARGGVGAGQRDPQQLELHAVVVHHARTTTAPPPLPPSASRTADVGLLQHPPSMESVTSNVVTTVPEVR